MVDSCFGAGSPHTIAVSRLWEMADLYLAIADIHSNTEMLTNILTEHAHKGLKAIFAAGDITNFGQEGEARRLLSVFRQFAPELPLYFVAGNCDTRRARDEFEAQPGYLERRSAELTLSDDTEMRAIGAGGGLHHTGMTPFELKERDLESNLEAAYALCQPDETKNLIVLTHTPPRDTFADQRASRHLGSSAFEAFLYEHKPLLWICGHIHEGRGARYEGSTLLVNPGPAMQGCYSLIAIEHTAGGFRAVVDLRKL